MYRNASNMTKRQISEGYMSWFFFKGFVLSYFYYFGKKIVKCVLQEPLPSSRGGRHIAIMLHWL